MDAPTQYALAYALTTGAGLRGLLLLAAFSVAAHFGWVSPPADFAWLGSGGVTVGLCIVAFLDLIADKIPVVDHGLHLIHVVIKPAAAAILVAGIVHPPSHAVLLGLMALGALNALGVHAAVASARAASTATTVGVANPVLSLGEDVGAVGLSVLAVALPYVGAAVAAVLLGIVVLVTVTVRALRRSA